MRSVNIQHESDWHAAEEAIRRQRYGVIETTGGVLAAIHYRPWPKLLAWPELWPVGPVYHAHGQPDRCLLYYNQPLRYSNFLALKYLVSTRGASFATVRAALVALEHVARVKRTDALLCDAFNARISDRLMRRFGWASHRPQRWHRNYVKRFYGCYPDSRLPVATASASTASAGVGLVTG